MSTTTHKDKDSARSHEQQQIAVLTPPAEAAFGWRKQIREGQIGEKASIAEFKRVAVEIGASKRLAKKVLMDVGFPERTAEAYSHGIDSIQRDPEVKEQFVNRDISFEAGAKAARYNRKVQDPEKAMDMLRIYIDKASKLAIDNELSQEEFIGRCTSGYTRAKNRKTN